MVLHGACALVASQKTFTIVLRNTLSDTKVCGTTSCRLSDTHPPDRLDLGSGNHG